MKEIEILYKLNSDIENAILLLKKNNAEFTSISETIDTYFTRDDIANLKPNNKGRLTNCLRLRSKGDKNYITYKKDYFDDKDIWIYSDEFETNIGDVKVLENILKILGFKELIIVDNTKHIFNIDRYEIALESVKNLGDFIEIEYSGDEKFDSIDSINNKKEEMRKYVLNLGINIGEEMNAGKPELMLKNIL